LGSEGKFGQRLDRAVGRDPEQGIGDQTAAGPGENAERV